MDIWEVDPFAGPADTSFPYANQILYTTTQFIVPGSCPVANPPYPYPAQALPQFTCNSHTRSTLESGTEIEFIFTTPPPVWEDCKTYCAVFFHDIANMSMPFNTTTNMTTIPDFDTDKGLIVGVIADMKGATYKESVVAGPVLLVEQPKGAIKLG